MLMDDDLALAGRWSRGCSQLAYSFRHDSRADSDYFACRHGRVLCVGRVASASGVDGPAGSRWRNRESGRCRCCFVRGAPVRCALGAAVVNRQTSLPACSLPARGPRVVRQGQCRRPGNLRPVYAARGALVARRSIPRRHRFTSTLRNWCRDR